MKILLVRNEFSMSNDPTIASPPSLSTNMESPITTTKIQSSMPELRRTTSMMLEPTEESIKQYSQPSTSIGRDFNATLALIVSSSRTVQLNNSPATSAYNSSSSGISSSSTKKKLNFRSEWDEFCESESISREIEKPQNSQNYTAGLKLHQNKCKNILADLELLQMLHLFTGMKV